MTGALVVVVLLAAGVVWLWWKGAGRNRDDPQYNPDGHE